MFLVKKNWIATDFIAGEEAIYKLVSVLITEFRILIKISINNYAEYNIFH